MDKYVIVPLILVGLFTWQLSKYIDRKFEKQNEKFEKRLADCTSKVGTLKLIEYPKNGDEYLVVNMSNVLRNANPSMYKCNNI